MLFADLDTASRALLLSQSGEGASCALTVLPTGPDFVVPSEEFRVLLQAATRTPANSQVMSLRRTPRQPG